ncbi:hypothetical protein BY996DRAFT_6411051 [Phakopsora pachyrhizi]|uniref:Expressed protein n=1 Tax=Phakopsora pachyrhizi TaxID=170000 RepID=A0AAV0AI33_PHAPC|nr:hypothetical protein BY996DRAFT_6411051 [Phakopsora pachyrhizi]CAH7668058.1 expressed protein [Phakopsora pachyrhizi]
MTGRQLNSHKVIALITFFSLGGLIQSVPTPREHPSPENAATRDEIRRRPQFDNLQSLPATEEQVEDFCGTILAMSLRWGSHLNPENNLSQGSQNSNNFVSAQNPSQMFPDSRLGREHPPIAAETAASHQNTRGGSSVHGFAQNTQQQQSQKGKFDSEDSASALHAHSPSDISRNSSVMPSAATSNTSKQGFSSPSTRNTSHKSNLITNSASHSSSPLTGNANEISNSTIATNSTTKMLEKNENKMGVDSHHSQAMAEATTSTLAPHTRINSTATNSTTTIQAPSKNNFSLSQGLNSKPESMALTSNSTIDGKAEGLNNSGLPESESTSLVHYLGQIELILLTILVISVTSLNFLIA